MGFFVSQSRHHDSLGLCLPDFVRGRVARKWLQCDSKVFHPAIPLSSAVREGQRSSVACIFDAYLFSAADALPQGREL